MTPRPIVAIGKSDCVFSGTLVKAVDPREGESYRSGGDLIEYVFSIKTIWKGAFEDTAVVYSARSGATCGYVFQANEEYLVFARWFRGFLSSSLCSGTKPLERASEDLAVLAELPMVGSSAEVNQSLIKKLIEQTAAESESSRVEAIWLLGAIAREPDLAIPVLSDLSQRAPERERAEAIRSLSYFDDETPRIIKPIVRALADSSALVRQAGVVSLTRHDEDVTFVMPLLLEALEDSSERVRATACSFLGNNRYESATVVPRLVTALEDEAADVRRGAANALGSFGHEAEDAIPTLLTCVMDTSAAVRETAICAIESISQNDSLVIETLDRGIQDSDAWVRRGSLSRFESRRFRYSPSADQAHLNALSDENADIRKDAADYFKGCCEGRSPRPVPESNALLDALVRAAKDTSGVIRASAISALGGLARPNEVLPYLITALEDPDAEVRYAALREISRIEPSAKIALPSILPLLEDQNRSVQRLARIVVDSLEGGE